MPLMRHRQADGPRLEPGTYLMECTRVREDFIPNSQYGKGDVIKLTLQTTDVVDPDGEPIELEAMANDSLTPRSKLTGWLFAFGLDPEVDDIDIEDAVGKRAMVSVGVDDTGQWNRITGIVAPPRTSQKAARAAVKPSEAYHPAAKDGEPITDAEPAPEEALLRYAKLYQVADGLGINVEPFVIEKGITKAILYEKGVMLRDLVEAAKKDELLDEAQAMFGGKVE